MDYYRVNKDWARIENQSSAGESVLSTISKEATTLFSVTITESTGNVRRDKSRHQLGSSSGADFQVGRDSLSVMIFESTGTVCADQSGHQMWRQSR
jgi:hypothetical protein